MLWLRWPVPFYMRRVLDDKLLVVAEEKMMVLILLASRRWWLQSRPETRCRVWVEENPALIVED
jgi:hypothetical protein